MYNASPLIGIPDAPPPPPVPHALPPPLLAAPPLEAPPTPQGAKGNPSLDILNKMQSRLRSRIKKKVLGGNGVELGGGVSVDSTKNEDIKVLNALLNFTVKPTYSRPSHV